MVPRIRSLIRTKWASRKFPVLGVMVFGWFMVIGLRIMVPSLLPTIKADFHLTNLQAGTAVSILWITYAVMQFPSGALSDRFGERAILLMSTMLIVLSVLSYSLSITFLLFLLATGLLGLGTGLFGTPRTTVLTYSYPDSEGTALGITFAAGSVGAASFPAIAALVAVRYGWRTSFALSVPFLIVLLIGIYLFTPTYAADTRSSIELTSKNSLVAIVNGVSSYTVLLATVAFSLMLFGYQGFIAFFATYLVEMKGLSAPTAALFYSMFFVVGAVIQPTGGFLSDRYDDRYVMAGVAAISALSLVLLPIYDNLIVLLGLSGFIGFRRGVGPIATKIIVAGLPDDVEGSGLGLLRTFVFSISSAGSILVGGLADAGRFDFAMYVLGGITALATLLLLALPTGSERSQISAH